MWIVDGGKTRAKRVPNGRSVDQRCEACETVTLWVECDVFDRVELFSISLFDATTRRFVCVECGADMHPDDVHVPRRPAPARAPEPEAVHSSPRDTSRDVAGISPSRVGPHHPEIDEEIAALKRRLGKK